ncbi:hypothetical protein WBR16_30980 [Kribbella sp. CCNWLY201]
MRDVLSAKTRTATSADRRATKWDVVPGRSEVPDAVGVGRDGVRRDDAQLALQRDADDRCFVGVGQAYEQVVAVASPGERPSGVVLDDVAWCRREAGQADLVIGRPAGDPEQEEFAVPQDRLTPRLRPELPGDALNQCHTASFEAGSAIGGPGVNARSTLRATAFPRSCGRRGTGRLR